MADDSESKPEGFTLGRGAPRGRGRQGRSGRGRDGRGRNPGRDAKRQRTDEAPAPGTQRTTEYVLDGPLTLTFSRNPTRSDVEYVPDFCLLLVVSHFVITRIMAIHGRSGFVRNYSETMFNFFMARIAVFAILYKCRACNSLPDTYLRSSMLMQELDKLPGMRVRS